MDLRNRLTKEHSKSLCLEIVNYVGGDQCRFDLLFSCMEVQEKILSQRAAWAVSFCVEKHPYLLEKHLTKLPQVIAEAVHPAVIRNSLRALQFIDVIPEEVAGHILDLSFQFLLSEKEPVAIRSLASRLIVRIGAPIPELRDEIIEVFTDLSNHESPAVRSSIRQGLKRMKKRV